MRLLVLAVLFGAGLQAQTKIPPSALRPGSIIGLMACVPATAPGGDDGWCGVLALDASIVIDRDVSPPKIKAAAASVPVRAIQFAKVIHKLTAAQTAFPASFAGFIEGSLDVYWNGLLMAVGEDYTMGGTVAAPSVLFLPRATPQPGDIVTLRYAWQ